MSSNPPSSCCYQGVKHEGTPVGRFEQVEDFEVYISEAKDKSTENGILMYDNSYEVSSCTRLTKTALPTSSATASTTHSLLLTNLLPMGTDFWNVMKYLLTRSSYLVFMPDLFYGDAIKLNRPDDFDIQKWLKGEYNDEKKSHLPPVVDPLVEKSINTMKSKFGVKVRKTC